MSTKEVSEEKGSDSQVGSANARFEGKFAYDKNYGKIVGILDGRNQYPVWLKKLETLTKYLGVYDAIDENVSKWSVSKQTDEAMSHILNQSVGAELVGFLDPEASSRDNLRTITERVGKPRKAGAILETLDSLSFSDGDNVTQFIATVDQLTHELRRAGINSEEQLIVPKVLKALKGRYTQVSEFYRNFEKEPKLSQVYSTLESRYDEFQRERKTAPINIVSPFTGKCYSCGLQGHKQDSCTKRGPPFHRGMRNKGRHPQGHRQSKGRKGPAPLLSIEQL